MFWIDAGICDFGLDRICQPLMKVNCTVPIKSHSVTVIKVIKTG
jgi:hypothetical protein